MKEKILLADDVVELADAVGEILKYNNYDVDIVYDGKQALDKAQANSYNCIILDIMMPFMDGIETVKQIRKLNIKTPVILLTAKDLVNDKVQGLDAGANDYLTKPFEKEELLARIRALTRTKKEDKGRYNIGDIIFNKENSQISKDKITFNLNSKESEIMEFLIKNKERKVSLNELKQIVWMNEECSDKVVPMYITYLQEKFSALDANVIIDDINGYIIKTT